MLLFFKSSSELISHFFSLFSLFLFLSLSLFTSLLLSIFSFIFLSFLIFSLHIFFCSFHSPFFPFLIFSLYSQFSYPSNLHLSFSPIIPPPFFYRQLPPPHLTSTYSTNYASSFKLKLIPPELILFPENG